MLKLLKGQTQYKYHRPFAIGAGGGFYQLVCRQTRDTKGNIIPLLDNEGNPIFYQLQYLLDSDSDVLNEEQKQMLLQDPLVQGPGNRRDKEIPIQTTGPREGVFHRGKWKRVANCKLDVGRPS